MSSSKLFLFSKEIHLNSGVRLLLELYCVKAAAHYSIFCRPTKKSSLFGYCAVNQDNLSEFARTSTNEELSWESRDQAFYFSNRAEIDSAPSLNAVSRDKKSASVRQADVPKNFNPIWPRQKICGSTTKNRLVCGSLYSLYEINTGIHIYQFTFELLHSCFRMWLWFRIWTKMLAHRRIWRKKGTDRRICIPLFIPLSHILVRTQVQS